MKECDNCDHREMCIDNAVHAHPKPCKFWEGWIPVDEELPEEVRDVLCICENEQGHNAQFVMWHDSVWIFQGHVVPCKVLAWRELPKYERSKD